LDGRYPRIENENESSNYKSSFQNKWQLIHHILNKTTMNAKKMYSPILTPDSQHPMIRARNRSSNLMLSSQIKDNLCITCKYKSTKWLAKMYICQFKYLIVNIQ
jgi:hypothetical protein